MNYLIDGMDKLEKMRSNGPFKYYVFNKEVVLDIEIKSNYYARPMLAWLEEC